MGKVKIKGTYGGYSIKKSGIVDMTMSFEYDQLPETIEMTVGLNVDNDIAVMFNPDDESTRKILKLGIFRINGIIIGRDGDSKVKLNSMMEYTNLETLNEMSKHGEEPVVLLIKYELAEGANVDGNQ